MSELRGTSEPGRGDRAQRDLGEQLPELRRRGERSGACTTCFRSLVLFCNGSDLSSAFGFAQLKVHGFSGEVTNNLIIHNYNSAGMWFDDLWWDLRISRNVVVSHSDGDWAGIMLEVSTGPALLDNNVILTTGASGGIFESDSNNATIVQNLVANPAGAALYLSGTGGRHYNCRQVDLPGEGEACSGPLSADDVSWLSWGCGIKPTNSTTNKNYFAAGNIFLGNAPISVGPCGTNGTDGHVCCNNTLTRNAVGKKVDGVGVSGNSVTATTATLVGDDLNGSTSVDAGSRWNFSSELHLVLASDQGPTAAAGQAGGPGTDVDFFGEARAAGPVQAGPFANVAGRTVKLQLWPPAAKLDDELMDWQQFKDTFGRHFNTTDDPRAVEARRRAAFEQRLRFIREHNAEADAGRQSFRCGVNQYSDLDASEFRALLANRPALAPASRRMPVAEELRGGGSGPVPESVDWRAKNAVTPVKQQGNCGACWAL